MSKNFRYFHENTNILKESKYNMSEHFKNKIEKGRPFRKLEVLGFLAKNHTFLRSHTPSHQY